jgi:hypothetical protein
MPNLKKIKCKSALSQTKFAEISYKKHKIYKID